MLGLEQNYNNHFHHFHDNDPLSAHVVVTFILPFQNHFHHIVCDASDDATDFKKSVSYNSQRIAFYYQDPNPNNSSRSRAQFQEEIPKLHLNWKVSIKMIPSFFVYHVGAVRKIDC